MTADFYGGESIIASRATRKIQVKLCNLIMNARQHVPMYRKLHANLDIVQSKHSITDTLHSLPILSKSDLLAWPIEHRIDERYDRATLVMESTTGSTGQPFSIYVNNAYIRERNIRFLRGMWALGCRPWHKIMLLTDRYKAPKRVGLTRYYVPVEQSTTGIVAAYEKIRPHVLYGFLTPLRLLASELSAASSSSRLVFSTAEMLDPMTRRQLQETFGGEVSDLYGLTEMGLVAWQRAAAIGYVMVSDSIVAELVAEKNTVGRYRIIMTNLALNTSPIIRYDSGDIAHVEFVDERPVIVAIEGRAIDTLICPDGTRISPYRVTDALGEIPGLIRFKITQRHMHDLLVELEIDDGQEAVVSQTVLGVLESLLGPKLEIDIQHRKAILPRDSSKFRPVESHVAHT